MMLFSILALALISSTWSMFIVREDAHSAQINVNDYREISTFKSSTGVQKFKSQQQYKGVDIFGATMVFEQTTNTKSAVIGTYYDPNTIKQDINDDVTPLISQQDAIHTAITYYIPNGDETSLFGYDWGERTLVATLNLYKDENDGIHQFTLSYIVQFTFENTATEHVYRPFSVIDAKSGEMLFTFSAQMSQGQSCPNDEAYGTGGNAKLGDVLQTGMCINQSPNVENDRVQVFAYPIVGSTNPQLGQCITNTPICEIRDTLVNSAKNALADAYQWGNAVFNLYDDWGPRNSLGSPIPPLAPNNLPLKFYVHYGTNYENAFYSGGSMSFGDGNTRFYPLVSLDVSAHEVAHGFTDQGSGLVYRNQPGGINEAYSDLAGEAAEAYVRGEGSVKWVCGYDIDKRGNCGIYVDGQEQCGLRYLYNPPLDGNSIDHVNDYRTGMNVHYSSGPYNKGWYLLATQNGWYDWSVQDVFLLASQANYYYWGPNTEYNGGVCGMQAAVEDIFESAEWEGRKQDIDLAWGGQGIYCVSSNGNSFTDHDTTDNISSNDAVGFNYYMYGAIAAGLFVVGVIIFGLFYYRYKANVLHAELNGGSNDKYGSLVTDVEQ